MRKGFSYLVVAAMVTIVSIVVGMIAVLMTAYESILHNNMAILFRVCFTELSLGILLCHGISLLFIRRKHYPDKTISKPLKTYFTILGIVCWILIVVLWGLFIFFAIIETDWSTVSGYDLITMALFVVPATLFLLQLIGGQRLVNTIQRNALEQLVNSFDNPE